MKRLGFLVVAMVLFITGNVQATVYVSTFTITGGDFILSCFCSGPSMLDLDFTSPSGSYSLDILPAGPYMWDMSRGRTSYLNFEKDSRWDMIIDLYGSDRLWLESFRIDGTQNQRSWFYHLF